MSTWMNFIYAILLMALSPARAETFLTYDEVALSVTDAPTDRTVVTVYRDENYRTIERPMRTVYLLQAVQGSRKVELSEREFNRLSILFKNRTRWVSGDELNEDLLRLFGEREPDWALTVEIVNERIRGVFNKAMILTREDGFKLAEPPGRTVEDRTIVYEIHNSGKGITYRGRWIALTPKQIEILRVLEAAPARNLSFPDMRLALGNSAQSLRPKENVDDINKECLRLAGAALITFERKIGFTLRPLAPPRFSMHPEKIAVNLPAVSSSTPIPGLNLSASTFEMTLGPIQASVYRTLKLGEHTPGDDLEISHDTYESVGLPIIQLRQVLASINHEYVTGIGMPLLVNVDVKVNVRGETFWRWNGERFRLFSSSREAEGSCGSQIRKPDHPI